jgi:hypothetical protein
MGGEDEVGGGSEAVIKFFECRGAGGVRTNRVVELKTRGPKDVVQSSFLDIAHIEG